MNIDKSLVEAAKRGDKDSFTALYQQISTLLYRSALYTLGNKSDAEDVVSETFLEAWHGIAKLRDPEAFQTWIYRILSARCKRKIKEYIKNRNTYNIDQFSDDSFSSSVPNNSINQNCISTSIMRTDLLNAFEVLSPTERQIVCLSVLDGYTTKEISQIMLSPHGTISSKLFRALKKMRKVLE